MSSCCQNDRHHRRFRRNFECCPDFQEPLVFIKSIPHNKQTGVSPNIKAIKLIFGRDFDDDQGLVNAHYEIDLWQGGDIVPTVIRRSRRNRGCDGRKIVLVIPIDPLLGGKTYKLRIKCFYVNRFGERFSRCRLIVFTTGCR